MTPRQLFRVVAATLGLWYFLRGVMYVFDALTFALGLAKPFEEHYTVHWYAVRGIFEMLLGFFVMGGVPAFERIAFPRHPKEMADGTGDETATTSAPK